MILTTCGQKTRVNDSILTCHDLEEELDSQLAKLSEFREMGQENVSYLDDSLPEVNQKIFLLIKNLETNPGLTKCEFRSPRLTYVSSTDDKLKFVSWNTGQGGTMIDFATVAIFQRNDSIEVEWLRTEQGENLFENFYEIYTLQDHQGRSLYLVKTYVIGSTLVRQKSIKAYELADGLRQATIFPRGESEIYFGYEASQDSIVDIKVLDNGRRLFIPIIDGEEWTGVYDELIFNGVAFTNTQHKR
jgi:hypothetical protein